VCVCVCAYSRSWETRRWTDGLCHQPLHTATVPVHSTSPQGSSRSPHSQTNRTDSTFPVRTDETSDRRHDLSVDRTLSQRADGRRTSGCGDSQTESCSWLLCHCCLSTSDCIRLPMNLRTPPTIVIIFEYRLVTDTKTYGTDKHRAMVYTLAA